MRQTAILIVFLLTPLIIIGTCLDAMAGGSRRRAKKKTYTCTVTNKSGYPLKITDATVQLHHKSSYDTKKMDCNGKVLYKEESILCRYKSSKGLKGIAIYLLIDNPPYNDQPHKYFESNNKTWKVKPPR